MSQKIYEEIEELIEGLENNIDKNDLYEMLYNIKNSIRIRSLYHWYIEEYYNNDYSDRFILLKKALCIKDYDLIRLYMKNIFLGKKYISNRSIDNIISLFDDAIEELEDNNDFDS